ncbi:MAG: hypothetical protein ABW061_15145 [Polyangiaceae bacterium]
MNQRGILLETPGAWSEPLHWPLRDGEQKLLTVGSNADWSIADGALLPVHATLYFDGASLCVAAAPGALLNGEPIGSDWSPVALPAQLSLGETKITIAPSEQPALAAASDELPGFTQKMARTLEPEADRPTPSEAFPSPFIDPDATLLALPALLPTPAPASPEPVAPATIADASAKSPPPRSAFVHSFQSASRPKRLTLLLLPVVIGLFAIKAVRQHSVRQGKLTPPTPSASAARNPPSAPRPESSSQAMAFPSVPTPLSNETRAAGLTLQRRAVDAFATGNFRDAALLYQRLAAENPGQAAFAVAARLASERANGVGP